MENTETTCTRGSASLFFLAGLGAGITFTVLFAPRSGTATRRLIGRTFEDGEDWIKVKTSAAKKFVGRHGEGLGDRVKEIAGTIKRS